MSKREYFELVRRPTRRATARALGWVLLTSAICWYFGVNVWHSILLGCAITVAGLAAFHGASIPELRDIGWRHRSRANAGSRTDVARLSESLNSGWEAVGLTAERRLRQIAQRRLALEGLDLRNPDHREAIERRVGTRAYRILGNPSGRRPRLHTVISCLDALDALDASYYPPPAPRSRLRVNLIPPNLRRLRDR